MSLKCCLYVSSAHLSELLFLLSLPLSLFDKLFWESADLWHLALGSGDEMPRRKRCTERDIDVVRFAQKTGSVPTNPGKLPPLRQPCRLRISHFPHKSRRGEKIRAFNKLDWTGKWMAVGESEPRFPCSGNKTKESIPLNRSCTSHVFFFKFFLSGEIFMGWEGFLERKKCLCKLISHEWENSVPSSLPSLLSSPYLKLKNWVEVMVVVVNV